MLRLRACGALCDARSAVLLCGLVLLGVRLLGLSGVPTAYGARWGDTMSLIEQQIREAQEAVRGIEREMLRLPQSIVEPWLYMFLGDLKDSHALIDQGEPPTLTFGSDFQHWSFGLHKRASVES